VKIITNHGGLLQQKELRKLLPMSESQLSVVLTKLQKAGQIKKVKRGRVNFIQLP